MGTEMITSMIISLTRSACYQGLMMMAASSDIQSLDFTCILDSETAPDDMPAVRGAF